MDLSRLILGGVLAMSVSSTSFAQTHRYSFDGDANDSIGGAHGSLMGTTSVSGEQLVLPGGDNASGNFLNLPAATIAINTYTALTLEMWSTQPTANQGFSMTAVFGGTWDTGVGQDYLMIATTRGDDVSKAAIANTPDNAEPWLDEVGVTGPELNDDLQHYYALTISGTELSYYIDGALQGSTPLGAATLSALSTQFAYLGRGVYNGDAMVQGSINEFRIWDQALSADRIAAHNVLGPDLVPEPSLFALLGLGIAGLIFRHRRA
jgi:hypothetical protein